MKGQKKIPEMQSRQSRLELVLVLVWGIMHVAVLPITAGLMYYKGIVSEITANLLVYAVGLLFMLLTQLKFLRRDFDAVCDKPARIILEICGSYIAFICMNLVVSLALLQLLPDAVNPNNAAIAGLAKTVTGPTTAMAVFMAPLVEELIFRAGVFGTLRRVNRIAAYLVSAALFSVYHVVAYALQEPVYWVYLLQYVPVSILLARCYERTDSIWTPVFLHMLVNYLSLKMLSVM